MVRVTARYPAPMRALHWLSAALVVVAYITAEGMEDGGDWHVASGLLLPALFLPRLLGHLLRCVPPAAPSSRPQAASAALVHVALLLFVVVQPLLGMAAIWAEGHAVPVPFTAWALPAPFPVTGWGEAAEDAHEVVGNVFYAVIGLHVLAALWHRWVRRDDVLQRML
nr:cytochrome b/b6 domain-containing protein [Lysobacter segetis]